MELAAGEARRGASKKKSQQSEASDCRMTVDENKKRQERETSKERKAMSAKKERIAKKFQRDCRTRVKVGREFNNLVVTQPQSSRGRSQMWWRR